MALLAIINIGVIAVATSSLKRILIAEDDSDIRLIAQLALESIGGFQVRLCSSGREAIQAAPGFQPDLIVLDVMMPGMDGPTTLQSLRALPQCAKTPIVFMTAKAQPHEIAQYKVLGAFDVIAKPFEPMQLSVADHVPNGCVSSRLDLVWTCTCRAATA